MLARRLLPSMVTTSPWASWATWATCWIQSIKQLWNCSGSKRENTSPKVSWHGMPPGSSRNVRNHSSLLRPNISICTHESAPQIVAQMAMAMMSSSLCRLLPSILGPSTKKQSSLKSMGLPLSPSPPPRTQLDNHILHNPNIDLFVKTPRQPGARWG